MKKLFALVAVALMACSINVKAQEKGDITLGAQFVYGMESNYKNMGLGVKMQYGLTDNIRLEPSFNYFFEKDYLKVWDVNINAHYVFKVAEKFNLYPLAGITMVGLSPDEGDGETYFGGNIGVGAEYWFTPAFALNAEMKYQIVSDFDRPVLGIGCIFAF